MDDFEEETVTCKIEWEVVGTIDILRLLRGTFQHLCVFDLISDLTKNFCLQMSFTFSSITLPLLYKDLSNEDNNLFIDNYQLQPLNSLDSSFINTVNSFLSVSVLETLEHRI